MTEIFAINQIIQWRDDTNNPLTERILWIDSDSTIAYVIDIFANSGFPIVRTISEIKTAIENKSVVFINYDPLIRLIVEDEIKPKNKKIRDKAWSVIHKLVEAVNEPDIYKRGKRGELVNKVVEEYNITHMTVYKYLRKYWQRGKNKNALLPDYENSGGKGKEKKLGEKKIGRPRKNSEVVGYGINIDEETKKIFRVAINKFYNTQKENSFTMTYDLMIKEFYAEDYMYENGTWKPILIPIDKIPTLAQFKYWFEKELNIKETITKRKGSKKFELEHRAVLGKSDTNIIGPGAKYQIDATIGDIYLVSRYNRKWIIGRPVIYVVIDVFSRMIAGIYVGLEGPSWAGAMMALANASSDKVKYCKEYDIDIGEDEWPCKHIPETILADRGEMEGNLVENYINSLQVRIENTPPYRADWKGIVEQYFHTINGHVKPLLPGTILPDFRQRGGKDYRLDAKLDMFQFTQIIIKCVLYHNNQHWLKDYSRLEDMIIDDVDSIPRDMWNWGIKNRSGRLRTFPENIIKLNLMPSAKARVTAKGIKFGNLYYACDVAIKEQWFETARNKGTWQIDISYDPRNVNYIYIRMENGRDFEKCYLLDSQVRFMNKSLDEIVHLLENEKLELEKERGKLQQDKVNLLADIESIVKNAEEMTNSIKISYESKTSRLKNIKENRKEEKLLNRDKEAFILENEPNIVKRDDNVIILNEQVAEESNSEYSEIELLKKKQRERLNARRNR